jgi:DNA polymerase III delta prime subunit
MQPTFLEKYIPKNLESLCCNKNFIDFVKNIINIEYLNIILYGNHASGKTTLIKCIINEYYNNNSNIISSNVLYLNSIKDHGILYYRNEVKLFCQLPSLYKKKLLIIDDIDLIDQQCQQIIRTYIDKWSHNFYLIASTNNMYKVDDNIQSRLFIVEIPPKPRDLLHKFIHNIIEKEQIKINDEVIEYILDNCENSTKIILNYLQKYKLINKPIDLDFAKNNSTIINNNDFLLFTQYCKNNDFKKAMDFIHIFLDKGYSVIDILENYFTFIKNSTELTENEKYKIIKLISQYIIIFNTIHEDNIELFLFTNNLIKIF